LANNQDLKIKIVGTLNTGKSIGEINTAIRGIEQKIKKLKLKIEVDENVLSAFAQFNKQFKQMESIYQNTTSGVLKGNKFQLKSIGEVADGYDKLTKKVEKYNAEQKKISETVTLADKNNIKSKAITTDADGKLVGITETFNAEKELKLKQQALKEEQNLIDQLAKAREKSTIKQREEERKLAEQQAKAINKNLEDKQKEIQKQEELNRKIREQISLYQQTKQIQVADLKNRYGSGIDSDALDKQLKSTMAIDPSSITSMNQLKNIQKDVDLGFKNIQVGAKKASKETMDFGSMMNQAFTKFPIWINNNCPE
jgi:DNA repair exonuclease SbcCD ATPase subunit